MIDTLVMAGTVITVDSTRRVLHNAAIAIDEGLIVAVGPAAEVAPAFPAHNRIDMPGGIAMPGLVDAHGHAGHSLIRTMGDDLAAWMDACEAIYLHGATPEFWRAEARLTAVERLMAGTTTSLSMLGGAGDTIRCDDPSHGHAHLEGITDVGLRAVMAIGPGAPPFPKRTTRHADGTPTTIETSFEGQMDTVRSLVAAWRDHEKAHVALTYPTLSLEDLGLMPDPDVMTGAAAVRDLSDNEGLLIVQDGHRGDSVEASHRLGLLTSRSLFSHSIDLTDTHISLLADSGGAVAHNPSAIYSQFGRCPVPELLDAGVTVGLGSDATAPDRSADMFRHMFQLTRYHRADRRDPALFPPGTAIELATIGSATALGLADRIGSLEVGKAADVIVIDAAKPHLAPLSHPVHQVVYFATGADVDTVIVGGEVLMTDRTIPRLDVAAVLDEAASEQEAAFGRVGVTQPPDRDGLWGATRYTDGPGLDL